MSSCNIIRVGSDKITLVKLPTRPSALGYVAKIGLPPRCEQYLTPYEHDETITLYVLEGTIELDVEGERIKAIKDSRIDIEAGQHYRLMGVEFHKSAVVFAYFGSRSVIDDWVEVADEVNQRGQRHRDGMIRYR